MQNVERWARKRIQLEWDNMSNNDRVHVLTILNIDQDYAHCFYSQLPEYVKQELLVDYMIAL